MITKKARGPNPLSVKRKIGKMTKKKENSKENVGKVAENTRKRHRSRKRSKKIEI